MLSKAQMKKLRRMIRRYGDHCVNASWIGTEDAEGQEIIRKNYVTYLKKMNEYLKSITQEETNASKSSNTRTAKVKNGAGPDSRGSSSHLGLASKD